MAAFGAKYPCFCPEGAETGVVIGKLVSANLTIQMASGELAADDAIDEQLSEFVSGTVAMETNDMEDDAASVVYGSTVTDGVLIDNTSDNAPRGVLAYYKTLMRNSKKYYRTYVYPRAKAALGNDNAQTKGSNINFQTTATSFTVFADDNGDWRRRKVFDKEEDAIAYIRTQTKLPTTPPSAPPEQGS